MTDAGEDLLVDARGHHCPVPTLRLRRALEVAQGRVVRLVANDPMARIDVPHFVREAGAELIEATETAGVLTFRVRHAPV
ncbi:MAG: sulfurtransferase TusA family protein [Phenylobacterium sp.]|uniref:sulfurtransferase TusA family protein n=1 Tax=Phenylobacterium sp. TaxID=1871053 RepID=UPI0025E0A3D0|nr:sulfurtransferase TusA family protein [Phenylobacterium sp.]MCA6225132.1 sulfurtransferase TusA family protein [Phenylobacterium sp.]MCA6227162.1 sulfurtransferase TusA family protein [Phenylobacterium sp.]MCA6233123.1 sulfurtransferase TusA family protein [Phenylobacterium sp.]MCA6234808.1 sulfurtransferase TusA family protein [Phenylobacterium sp.]MCA6250146.1 sulfurtransferase TusA family protein [Phenylobacterium sp.]